MSQPKRCRSQSMAGKRKNSRRSLVRLAANCLFLISLTIIALLAIMPYGIANPVSRVDNDEIISRIPAAPVAVSDYQVQPDSALEVIDEGKRFEVAAAKGKIAYLTFDDGPDPVYTHLVLETLKLNEITATFFVVGNKALKHQDMVRAIVDDGHAIGNHSLDHDYDNCYRSPAALKLSIDKTQSIIFDICKIRPNIWRPPGGVTKASPGYRDIAASLGLKTILWNITTGDGDLATQPARMVSLVRYQLEKEDGSRPLIILMHDDRYSSAIALQMIIDILKDAGYSFLTIDQSTPQAW